MSEVTEELVEAASAFLRKAYEYTPTKEYLLATRDGNGGIVFYFQEDLPPRLKPFEALFNSDDFYHKSYGGFTLTNKLTLKVKKQLDKLADKIVTEKTKYSALTTNWYSYTE